MKKFSSIPLYMNVLYNRLYSNKSLCGVCDDSRIVNLRTLWHNKRIVNDVVHDIAKNAHVLQIGVTFGDEIATVYKKVCKHGKLDVFDVLPEQIKRAKEKYYTDNIDFIDYNAALPWDEKYDVVICYNLLRELPLKTRQEIMDNALAGLATGGKAIFVDYAKPEPWNILYWPLLWFNRLYQPMAESMTNQPLESFCKSKDEFRWHHKYYCGRLWQKTIAVRKILSNEDVRKLTKLFRGK